MVLDVIICWQRKVVLFSASGMLEESSMALDLLNLHSWSFFSNAQPGFDNPRDAFPVVGGDGIACSRFMWEI